MVVDYDPITKIATIEQRNHFVSGEKVEMVGPKDTHTFVMGDIRDLDGNLLDAARHPKQILKIELPFKVQPYDMLRKVLPDDN